MEQIEQNEIIGQLEQNEIIGQLQQNEIIEQNDQKKMIELMKKIIEDHFINDLTMKFLFNFTITDFKNSKFDYLQKILSNTFIDKNQKKQILTIFYKIQRFFHAIYRLKNIWRLKKANIYNTDDLYMNPIHIGEKNTLVLLQNNTKYVFHIRELIRSINSSLSNACHFFIEPLVCKNPYTNIPFNKSALYNIYFAIRESTFIMPTLFHEYFLSGFNLSNYSINNEQIMNYEYLRTYVDNNCVQDVYERVREMFAEHHIVVRINKDFPIDKLFTIMKPYLTLYYSSNYSLNTYNKVFCYKKLHMKLHEFKKFNPNFGRKKVHLTETKPFSKFKKIEYYFDDNHVDFYESVSCDDSKKSFMNSHLCKKEYYNRSLHTARNNYIHGRRYVVEHDNISHEDNDSGDNVSESEQDDDSGVIASDQDNDSSEYDDSDDEQDNEENISGNTLIIEDSDDEDLDTVD